MTDVSVSIMAHPSRSEWANDLSDRLSGAPIAWAEPPWATHDDRGPCWRTKKAALLLHGDAPFHCVIQDDVILARNFTERIAQLTDWGDFLYMLFYRHKRTWPEAVKASKLAVATGQDYFIIRGMLLGPGIIVRTERIPDMITFCDGQEPTWGDDDRLKVWARSRHIDTFVPIPSLVDHRIGPSLIGHPEHRVAWKFAS